MWHLLAPWWKPGAPSVIQVQTHSWRALSPWSWEGSFLGHPFSLGSRRSLMVQTHEGLSLYQPQQISICAFGVTGSVPFPADDDVSSVCGRIRARLSAPPAVAGRPLPHLPRDRSCVRLPSPSPAFPVRTGEGIWKRALEYLQTPLVSTPLWILYSCVNPHSA